MAIFCVIKHLYFSIFKQKSNLSYFHSYQGVDSDVSDNFRIFKGYKKVNTCNDGQCRVLMYYILPVHCCWNNQQYACIYYNYCMKFYQASWVSVFLSPARWSLGGGYGVGCLAVCPAHRHRLGSVDVPLGGLWDMTYLNDRPSAIINFTMPDIWKTVPDSQTIRPTIKTKRTEVLYHPHRKLR